MSESVEVGVPADDLWAYIMDWARQGEWIPMTRVRAVDGVGASLGADIEAWTGIGRIGFMDSMTITEWDPPRLCSVEHTGRVVRGTGDFRVVATGDNRSRFDWHEDLEIPLGRVGYAGWQLTRPAFMFGVRRALQVLKREAEAASATA